uniref:NTP pyrophosphohydrolase MazG-like domain-containing protein n=1 Tax=Alexandrium catenella TaxID=2925 RepID=A0A7S1MSX3_ALECA
MAVAAAEVPPKRARIEGPAELAPMSTLPTPSRPAVRFAEEEAPLELSEYQRRAMATAFYPQKGNNVAYAALGLAGESGEVANKVKKVLRDAGGDFSLERRREIADEVGDVLWYAAALANELGVPLEEIARRNLAKLKSRSERGAMAGSGDRR